MKYKNIINIKNVDICLWHTQQEQEQEQQWQKSDWYSAAVLKMQTRTP